LKKQLTAHSLAVYFKAILRVTHPVKLVTFTVLSVGFWGTHWIRFWNWHSDSHSDTDSQTPSDGHTLWIIVS